MRRGKGGGAPKANRGFTLFEMVVVICSIAILYMVAEQRLNELPGAAERVNFYAVLEQIKTGVNFEMVTKLAAGRADEILQMEGKNPMQFLIEPPSNYRGELERVTDAVQRRNSWYFETQSGELVYVVGGASINDVKVNLSGFLVPLGQIRLKLTNVYTSAGSAAGPANTQFRSNRNWEALLLVPVNDYTWERLPDAPIYVQ